MSLAVPLADRWSFRSPCLESGSGPSQTEWGQQVEVWLHRGSTGGTWAGTMTMVGGMMGLLATKDGVHREEKEGREGGKLAAGQIDSF